MLIWADGMHPSDPVWPRCACGCGEPVPARKAGCAMRGFVKGEPCKFVAGHSNRARWKLPVGGLFECALCRTQKLISEFHRDGSRPSGLNPWCKECMAAKARARYLRSNPTPKYKRWPSNDARHRANASAYRARKRGQFVEHVDPVVVFERDAGICGICSAPVDADAFHIDHVVPLARGGEHSYANAQTAHPSCNMRKHDKLQEELVNA